jgi:outer membrane protein
MSLTKRSRLLLNPIALALGLAGLHTARAEDLVELYNAARAYDATYLGARALAESAEYKAAQADALLLPGVNGSSGASYTRTDPPATALNPSGNTVTGKGTEVKISGKQVLFNRANSATVAQARKSLDVARADLDTAEQDLIVRVAQAYFDVLAAQDTLATSRANKTAITEQLASAKRNFEVGTATITDTREAQARFDLATAQELAAENDLRTKRIALDQLVGRQAVNPKPLAVPAVLPPVVPADPEQWVASAEGLHPTIRKAALGLDVAKLETDKARAGHLPTVDLVGSYAVDHGWGNGSQTPGTYKAATIGVQLNVPIFAGFSIQNRVKETIALEEKSRDDLEAARRGVALGTRTAYFGVQSGLAQVKALEAAESSSKLALEATQLGYKVGVRVNLDVLNAQTQLFQTQRDLAKARYDVLVGELRLRQASGQLKPEDLSAINQLLAK